MDVQKLLWIFVSAMLVNNFTLSYFLGLCPFFGVSGKISTALRLSQNTRKPTSAASCP